MPNTKFNDEIYRQWANSVEPQKPEQTENPPEEVTSPEDDENASFEDIYKRMLKKANLQESVEDDIVYQYEAINNLGDHSAILENGYPACEACLYEYLTDNTQIISEAKYQGHSVPLNKPMKGDVKKFKVYVRNPSTGNIKKVNFGDPNMRIKKNNPKRRKSFRARHHCENPGPKTKARYWSCKKW